MNLKCISLASLIFLAAVASACGGQGSTDLSGAAVGIEEPAPGDQPPGSEPSKGEPSKPGAPNEPSDPNAPVDPSKGGESPADPSAGGANDLLGKVSGIAPTARVNHQVVEEACGDDAECLAQLELFMRYVAEKCTTNEVTVGCPQGIQQFATDIPASQLRAGRVPVGFPSAEDVAEAITDSQDGASSEPAKEEPAAEEPAPEEPVAKIAPTDYTALLATLAAWNDVHDRAAYGVVLPACGGDPDCVAELEAVAEFIRTKCGVTANCPAGIEEFLTKPSSTEVSSGELGETFPLTKDVLALVETVASGG